MIKIVDLAGMKKTLFLAAILTVLAIPAREARAASDDFASSTMGKELINIGLKFLDNPGDLFFNLHTDNEDFAPLPTGKNGSIRFNAFPTFLPFTWGNLNVKVNVLRDRGYYPQLDLVGMYGDMLALRAMASSMEDVKPVFNDYSVGLVASKAMNDKTKLFGGVKYASVNLQVSFSSSSAITFGEFSMNEINFKVDDTFFFTGISHEYAKDHQVVASCGYGFKYKKIIARIAEHHQHLELGMDIFPEGLFVIQPFLAWHWYF